MMKKKSKVFCIGFHKTGTSSIGAALEMLDFKVKGFSPELLNRDGIDSEQLLAIVEQYEAFQDNPWPVIYKELDQLYPGSKFILTKRDSKRWITSIKNHFSGRSTKMREFVYGTGDPSGNEKIYLERYENHNLQVINYFSERKGDLLEICLPDDQLWEKLCDFLGYPMPRKAFPHKNRKTVRTWWGRWLTKFRQKFNLDWNF